MIPREILRKVRRIEIRTRHRVNDVFAGRYHSVFKGRGMEFDEVRAYQPGDDVRAIDWNVTARLGHPFIKKFVEERELTVMLLADVSASHRFGSRVQLKKDLVAEMAAVLAFAAVRNNDRVGLILFAEDVEVFVPPAKGSTHVLRLVREALTHEPRRPGTRVGPAVEFLNRVTPRRTVAFLISDFIFPREETPRVLRVTARRHDLIALRVSDRREQAWPRAGVVRWRDPESGVARLLDTSDPRVRRALTRAHAAWTGALRDALRAIRVDLIEVETGEAFERAFLRFFQARERRLRF